MACRIIPILIVLLAGCQTMSRPGADALDADVAATLRSGSSADVVVALVDPVGYGEPGAEAERIRADIAQMQDSVLASVTPNDFRLRHRFTEIPALSGTILTEHGLEGLMSHPHVKRVDLDRGGTGGGAPDPPHLSLEELP